MCGKDLLISLEVPLSNCLHTSNKVQMAAYFPKLQPKFASRVHLTVMAHMITLIKTLHQSVIVSIITNTVFILLISFYIYYSYMSLFECI